VGSKAGEFFTGLTRKRTKHVKKGGVLGRRRIGLPGRVHAGGGYQEGRRTVQKGES